jgi:membrane protease YdiL (CAAX protease family)
MKRLFGSLANLLALIRDGYAKPAAHPFFTGAMVIACLVLYEVLLLVAKKPPVSDYNSVDVWFYIAQHYVPLGTLAVSAAICVYYWVRVLQYMYFGKKTPEEEAHEKKRTDDIKKNFFRGLNHELRRVSSSERENVYTTVPVKILEKDKKPYKPQWLLLALLACEGLLWGSVIFIVLPYGVWYLNNLLAGDAYAPQRIALDMLPSLRAYQSSPLQDVALAIGGGVYEELLYRQVLFGLLAARISFSLPIPGRKEGIPLDTTAVAVLCAFLYALSHIAFGDAFTYYALFYRFFFGLLLTTLYQRRGLPVSIWAHIFHDLWYFSLG